MPVSIKCPQCSRGLKVPDELIGRKVKCPGCSTSFTAEAGGAAAPAASEGSSAPRGGGEMRPHRGTMILILGIVGLVCFPADLICSPLAWIMGGKDLKAMQAGEMDPEGQGLTKAGWICGIIGTVLAVLGLCCGAAQVAIALMGLSPGPH
jgi:hypothetical protein